MTSNRHSKIKTLLTIVIASISTQLISHCASVSGRQQQQQQQQQQQSPSTLATSNAARDRCRELISLTLLSFKDLSPNERASEEIDCANLREQIAAATRRSYSTSSPPSPPSSSSSRNNVAAVDNQQQQQQPLPLNNYNNNNNLPPLDSLAGDGENYQPVSRGWDPRNSYMNQVQQLLIQQQQRQRQQNQQDMFQLYQHLAAANQQQQQYDRSATPPQQPTTDATTFESLMLETTTLIPTTTTTPATTTTTTTTTTTQRPSPKVRIGAPNGAKRRPNGGRAMRTSTTTTTTTTTTTPKPQTAAADYADGTEVSTDYYDEDYDGQQQTTTTTTTTTQRPHRPRNNQQNGNGGRKPKRRFSTTSTTPRPTTTSTTLSPGYQARPDGRIIDYMADPNLPRELKGVDLTNYPFYITVPDKIDFECKGRHDGYYTNIDLHCQIYHHCAIGNRYDFLCPNYTLFDQTTFTCRFVNTVDCDGSAKHFDRNNALYVEKDDYKSEGSSSSTTSTTTTTTTTTTTSAPKLKLTSRTTKDQPQLNSSSTELVSRPISALTLIGQQQQQQTRAQKQIPLIGGGDETSNIDSAGTVFDTTIR